MATGIRLRGIELRYVLTMALAVGGPLTVTDLADEIDRQGFSVDGRPSKAISDALRWEVGHGRVRRCGRGRYRSGCIPRSTEHRIWRRVRVLRRQAQSLGAGQFEEWFGDVTDGASVDDGPGGGGRAAVSLGAGQFEEWFGDVTDGTDGIDEEGVV